MPGIFFNEQSRFSARPSTQQALAAVERFVSVLHALNELSSSFWLCLDTDNISSFALDNTEQPLTLGEVLAGDRYRDHWAFLLELLRRAPYKPHSAWLTEGITHGVDYLHNGTNVFGLGAASCHQGVAVNLESSAVAGTVVELVRRALSPDGEHVLETVVQTQQITSSTDVAAIRDWFVEHYPPVKTQALETTTLYVEGGGDDSDLRSQCRDAFKTLLKSSKVPSHRFTVKACGGRSTTYRAYTKAVERGDAPCVLLVDSESSVTTEHPWEHLRLRAGDEWAKPEPASADDCHLMTQCMEMWLVADPSALSAFFGAGFQVSRLPKANLETVAKELLYDALANASKDCKTKDPYGKGAHSFKILKTLDPERIAAASPWAKRFFDRMAVLTRE